VHEREVLLVHRAAAELEVEVARGVDTLGEQQAAGRVAVEAMHDAQVGAGTQFFERTVDARASLAVGNGRLARRLVEHQQVRVLEQDHRFGCGHGALGHFLRFHVEEHERATAQPLPRPRFTAIDLDRAVGDQAAQRGAIDVRKRLGQEVGQQDAALRAGDFQVFHRDQRRGRQGGEKDTDSVRMRKGRTGGVVLEPIIPSRRRLGNRRPAARGHGPRSTLRTHRRGARWCGLPRG
jgi:hypothetical protein